MKFFSIVIERSSGLAPLSPAKDTTRHFYLLFFKNDDVSGLLCIVVDKII